MADSQFVGSGIISCSDRFNSRLAAQYAGNASFEQSKTDAMNSTSPMPGYASSTYSTSTTYTEKPMLESSSSSKKSSKVWKKTKQVLANSKLASLLDHHYPFQNTNLLLTVVEDRRPEYERREAEKRRAEGKPERSTSVTEAYGIGGLNPHAFSSRI